MDELIYLGRSISIAYRMANRFYDRALARWGIGCGQQFFLLRIYENRGSSVYDLARMGLFDKGTATRAVQKLEELGYVRSEADGSDKRVRRLYPTELAEPVVQAAYDARRRWIALLTRGMTPEEAEAARGLLVRIAENAILALEGEDRDGSGG